MRDSARLCLVGLPGRLLVVGVAVALGACGGRREVGATPETGDPPSACDNADLGCGTCIPGRALCVGTDVHVCDDTGETSTFRASCAADEACQSGVCVNACDAARAERSTVGCDYYAVDLDNAYGEGEILGGVFPNPSEEQFAVVLANPGDVTVGARVTLNEGPPGGPLLEQIVGDWAIAPRGLVRIDLPAREIDGSVTANDGPGTFLSSRAYRIRTNYPVVAYQFNTIVQSYSNDASTLIPISALGTHYRVMTHTSANPLDVSELGFPPEPGFPDHGTLTVVGTEAETRVQVTVSADVLGGGGVPATPKGGLVEVTLGPYDVLNLETRPITVSEVMAGELADLTGSVVTADRPVAVFAGAERVGIAPADWDPGEEGGGCCAEHIEEQLLPTTAWGTHYAVARSPVRSSVPGRPEPDVYRIMADRDGTTVNTDLDPPHDVILLDENQWVQLSSTRSFAVESDGPIAIQQLLVSQDVVEFWRPGHAGDPSMISMPAVEQYRDDYVFLVPDTFDSDYVVISQPVGTAVELDGDPSGTGACSSAPGGTVSGVAYETVTCPLVDGTHRVRADRPVGIFVYGYHSAGSYAYFGGSNIQVINPPI
jgi:hypothetical protein